ncbi:MAG: biotin/lipoyl-containing protein [Actinocrinis sp.]
MSTVTDLIQVTMPQLGETVAEGTVTRWLKQVGEPVADQEPLLEIATDKVDTEIPAPAAGIVRELLVAEDATVPVGTLLATIDPASQRPPATGAPVDVPRSAEPAPLLGHRPGPWPHPGHNGPRIAPSSIGTRTVRASANRPGPSASI